MLALILISVVFLVNSFLFGFWLEKNQEKLKTKGFQANLIGILMILQWLCFIAGMFLYTTIRNI
jgi:hypothetical protein